MVSAVYVHDSMTMASTTDACTSQAIVNWEVAAREWEHASDSINTVLLKLKTSMAEPSAARF